MNRTLRFLLVTVVSVLVGGCLHAQAAERLAAVVQREPDTGPAASAPPAKFSGTVTDSVGKPVAGATVEYWCYQGSVFQRSEPKMGKQITTGEDGAFGIELSGDTGFLLVRKSGLAPAWRQLNPGYTRVREAGNQVVLTPPGTLAGAVVDESNKPVANAEVFVAMAVSELSSEDGIYSFNYFSGKPARECFSARTDAAGHFQLDSFPTNASAVLAVRSPGKALQPSTQTVSDLRTAGYRAGQEDTRLVMEPAAGIEGKIVGADANAAVPIGRLTLQPDQPGFFANATLDPVHSSADGVFRFADIAAGSYHIQAVFGTNTPPDWVAEGVPVSVEAGQTARGLQVTAKRGALLAVSVVGKDDRKPLAQVSVTAYRERSPSSAVSDTNGIAWLRLLPGDYQISAYRQARAPSQTSATVETDRTNRVEIEVATPRKVSGIVHTPDGRAAAGVSIRLVGGYGPADDRVTADANGKFSLEWAQRPYGGQNDSTACVLARDAEHNLAAVQDIDEDTGALDLKLAPGLTLVTRVEADGEPITNATAQLVFWTGRSGMWLSGMARTNTPGRVEIPALPPGRKYGLVFSARGYGQKQMHDLETSSEAIRQELDPVELKVANLRLAGQVLDTDDKPVAGCYVNINGEGQPNAHVSTDRQGRFVFANVCEGAANLSANAQNSYGSVSAEGGDTNVVLRLGTRYGSSPETKTHKLKGTVTDDAGQPAAGAQVAVFPNQGTRWIKTGAKGEFNLTWSLQPWQARSGNALLVIRDQSRNLAAAEELSEDTTNLTVKLKPALTVLGQVKNTSDSPLTNAQVGLWLKADNSYDSLNEQMSPVNREGRYEIKCLPPDAAYTVYASAKGYGKSQQHIAAGAETNRLQLAPFVLKPADRVIAGRVLNDNEKPVSGVNIHLNGDDQPDGQATTDSKGRFHFQVCEGHINVSAYSQSGGHAQATVEAGDTNIVMNLSSSPRGIRQPPPRASLKGGPLPDLKVVNIAAEAVPSGQPVLLCLFDASQRPGRRVIRLLDQQAAGLQQKKIVVFGIQAAVISDGEFNEWKSTGGVSFPLGRVTDASEKSKWVSGVSVLPWLILADANHRVVAEGFSLDELDAQLQHLSK
jgi:protocatechuate 3,4-dioxygenase beta subunit